jgi:SAM-dependent methyltransferase
MLSKNSPKEIKPTGLPGCSARALLDWKNQIRAWDQRARWEWSGYALAGLAGMVWIAGRGHAWPEAVVFSLYLILGWVNPAWSAFLAVFVALWERTHEFPAGLTLHSAEILIALMLPLLLHHGPRLAWGRVLRREWVGLACLGLIVGFAQIAAHPGPQELRAALKNSELLLGALGMVLALRTGRHARAWLWFFMLAMLGQAWIGIAQSFGPVTNEALRIVWAGQERMRAAGTLGSNYLAMYFALILPWVIVSALWHPKGWCRALNLAAVLPLTLTFLLTFSLTGWLALTGALLAGIWAIGRPWQRLWILAAALFGLLGVWLLLQAVAGSSFWETKLASFGARLAYVKAAWQLFLTSPWLGIGGGNYRLLAPYLAAGTDNAVGFTSHPHSGWLLVLVEGGMVALALAGWAVGLFLKRTKDKISGMPRAWEKISAGALWCGICGFLTASFLDAGWIPNRGLLFGMSLGCLWLITFAPSARWLFGARRLMRVEHLPAESPLISVLEERSLGRLPFYQMLTQSISRWPKARILELGCGQGLDLCAMAQRFSHAACVGLDRSAAALRQAAENAQALGLEGISWQQGSLEKIPFPDQSFHVIFSQGVLEHLALPDRAWAEISRVLVPGGCVVTSVPQTWNLYTAIKIFRWWQGRWPWGWERSYTLGQLQSEARANGLKFLAAAGYGYWGGAWDLLFWLRQNGPSGVRQFLAWCEKSCGAWWMMNLVMAAYRPMGAGKGQLVSGGLYEESAPATQNPPG